MIRLPAPRWNLLDFPVHLRHLYTAGPDGKDMLVPGYRCVLREDTGDVLDVVSERYQLLRHGKIFRLLHGLAHEDLPWEVRNVRTRVGLNGGYASVEWEFGHTVEVADGDDVTVNLLAQNSLNRSASLSVSVSARRLLCSNGLRGPGPEYEARWAHLQDVLTVDGVRAWVRAVPERAPQMLERWKEWNDQTVFTARVREFLEEDPTANGLIGQRDRARLMRRLRTVARDPRGLRVSVWEAYNAVTWHATHHVKTRKPELAALREEEVHRLALKLVTYVTNG